MSDLERIGADLPAFFDDLAAGWAERGQHHLAMRARAQALRTRLGAALGEAVAEAVAEEAMDFLGEGGEA